MFSQTAEYALRAVVSLADSAGQPLTTQQIANLTQVPLDYLSKVMQALGRHGLVESQRGKHGGFTLARPADRLTILDVLNAVDPLPRIRSCPLHLKSHSRQLCPLHRRLDDAFSSVEKAFAETAISDLLEPQSEIRPLCEVRGAHD
jgi:Rrf2 family transcriptional regulator, nitric oxide-sensitive transcriptional repressor